MPSVQHASFATLTSPIHIGRNYVAVAHDDDSLFMDLGCVVSHALAHLEIDRSLA
jgi:hypothetical protein